MVRRKAREMPRFHFEVRGADSFPDPDGLILRNRAAARREAERLSAALVRDYPDVFVEGRTFQMYVLDDAGRTVETLAMPSAGTTRPDA
jgi:hypothetical protein